MKKIIVILFILVIVAVGINERENILIPNEAIRFRVIANSNSDIDQNLKMQIKDEVEDEIYKLMGNVNNIEDARNIIKDNINIIDGVVDKYNVNYDISFGNNYFPEKIYKGIKYNEGNYESLVITLGEGKGKNWWCVLFPPLCLLDEKENLKDADYEFYAAKIINKFR